ncbi:MAG TPA: Xaa-Pro peptidase family protein, partial [Thermoanaerobaculia bacterium]|nr:Xaa-Pro peptidase family protein [Thermoanaerobaculia bacterium]
MLADKLEEIQEALGEEGVDGWLFACFQANDPISLDLLGLSREHLLTRRCYYLIPAQGEPRKLVHDLEPAKLDHLPGAKAGYRTWRAHQEGVAKLVAGMGRLAAQYSPKGELPTVSRLDLGTADLLHGAGCTLVSSAELVQRFAATWSPEQLESHRRASRAMHRFVLAAFDRVKSALAAGDEIDEYTVQNFILERFDEAGLETDHPPNVSVGPHSADPHYQPSAEASSVIRRGDFLLIDLWARQKAPAGDRASIYADITWTAVCAPSPTDRQQEVFETVRNARDAALALVRSRFPGGEVRGFEVDDAARRVIEEAGFGEYFIHRTGHSIDASLHGQGANMDNLETHDTRRLIPWTGFSIEPGIYLP